MEMSQSPGTGGRQRKSWSFLAVNPLVPHPSLTSRASDELGSADPAIGPRNACSCSITLTRLTFHYHLALRLHGKHDAAAKTQDPTGLEEAPLPRCASLLLELRKTSPCCPRPSEPSMRIQEKFFYSPPCLPCWRHRSRQGMARGLPR